jgi:16S rRNA (guanine(1405)-N(7))-methyltransferase
MSIQNDQLEKLIETVRASSRYKEVSDDLIRDIGLRELAKRSSLREAVKATKSKLHQVGGAYLAERSAYSTWLDDVRRLSRFDSRENLLTYLKMVMSHHASTEERLPILDQFYKTILADLPPIHSVLDIACGFNPLALPWMPLTDPVEYYAYDIYKDMIDFLNQLMPLMRVHGQAQVCNVIRSCPMRRVDVAFVLKTIPCLEQVDKAVGSRLLHAINANYIVVSFPVHSLGGKTKGMQAHYSARFRTLVEDPAWSIKQFEFATELAFLITKQENAPVISD